MNEKDLVLSIEAVQRVYFDACDLINGASFADLGYDSKFDFYREVKSLMAIVEFRLESLKEETTA